MFALKFIDLTYVKTSNKAQHKFGEPLRVVSKKFGNKREGVLFLAAGKNVFTYKNYNVLLRGFLHFIFIQFSSLFLFREGEPPEGTL